MIIENVENAIENACKKADATIKEFTVAPVYLSNKTSGRHQWLIEFEKKPTNLNYFIEVLDNTLKNLNSDYEAKRYKDMILGLPEVIIVPQQTFYNWLKANNKLGGQHKVPRLSNDRKIVEEILSMYKRSLPNPSEGGAM